MTDGHAPQKATQKRDSGANQKADDHLDTRGLACPLPVLKARKRLLAMAPGAVLEVAATDPVAAIDMPHFCAEAGHGFLGRRSEGPVTYYLIRRGPLTPEAPS